MIVQGRNGFVKLISEFITKEENIVIKPNWVSNECGEYTEPEILDWLLSIFPTKKTKYVIESYTPWRGLVYSPVKNKDVLDVSLEGGKKYWDFYKEQDVEYLRNTGIGDVLNNHKCKYINITNEYWKNECMGQETLTKELGLDLEKIHWKELIGYIPKKLFDIRDSTLFISLAKMKEEPSIPTIRISFSVKNLFGLIPHPSRYDPFHKNNHSEVYLAVKDLYYIYTKLFEKSLWINEGIKTSVKNYCEDIQYVEKDKGLLFVGTSGMQLDIKTCQFLGLNPKEVPYLN